MSIPTRQQYIEGEANTMATRSIWFYRERQAARAFDQSRLRSLISLKREVRSNAGS